MKTKIIRSKAVGRNSRWIITLLALVSSLAAVAQISVGTNGTGTITFSNQPPASEWSTRAVPGTAGEITTPAGLDAQVQTNSVALINAQLASSTSGEPLPSGTAVWSTIGFVQTRPTNVRFTLLGATLRNDTGAGMAYVDIAYDFWGVASAGEEIPGHRVYFSQTGAAGSWRDLPGISGVATSGRMTARLDVAPWTNGALLYIVWADDNGSVSPDIPYQIDNFSATTVQLEPVITAQPANISALPGAIVSLNVAATGWQPLAYQWWRDGSPFGNATNASLLFTNVQASNSATYFVVITNAYGSITSTPAVLAVQCDSVAWIVQPAGTNINAGASATLAAVVSGTVPVTYQWVKDGQPVPGATNATLTFNPAYPEDTGIYAVAITNCGAGLLSTGAVLTVNCASGVSINAQPVAQSLDYGATISLAVSASGSPGIRQQWFRDGAAIPGATNATFIKSNAAPADSGSYHVALTNCAGGLLSAVVRVDVGGPATMLIGLTNQVWRYEQSGAELGTAWRAADYDDSLWPSGPGVLAREDNNALVLGLTRTTLSLTGTNGSNSTTFYFRTHFTLSGDPQFFTFISSNLIDDGVVLYVNGTEVARLNMPVGTITSATLASAAGVEGSFVISNLPPSLFHEGDNVLAAEVHQVGTTSADIVFGMALLARPLPAGPPFIASQPASTAVFAGQSATLACAATTASAMTAQWLHNGMPTPGATNPVITFSNAAKGDAGRYALVLSNASGVVTSAVATLSVLAGERIRLVEFTNTWRFNQSGADLATAWRAPGYVDSSWSNGAGIFRVSSQTNFPEPVNTTLARSNGSGPQTITYYFRTHFEMPPGHSHVALVSSNLLDDGGVYYVNGAESGRIRLAGPVSASTLASISTTEGLIHEPLIFSSATPPAGDNVLAAEVHQGSTNSSDVVFGMNLAAMAGYDEPVAILSPLTAQVVGEGSPASLRARVFGGEPLAFQWLHDGVPVAGETNVTIQFAAVHSAQTGQYTFIASNWLGAVTSAPAALTMNQDITPPSVAGAYATNGLSGVLVVFSEPVTAASATNPAHYHLSGGATILSALQVAPHVVLLSVSALDPQAMYSVVVSNIADLADAPNPITPATVRVMPELLPAATGLLQIQTVFIILMENRSWREIKGNTNAPYINSLLPLASYCENYHAPNDGHPSEPNYIWLEAGDNFGHDDDSGPQSDRVASTNHLSTQLATAGIEWRGYMEDLPPGSVGITNASPYLARHNPFAFFDDVTGNYDYCTNHVRPYAVFADDLANGHIGRYNFISPNITNDMHNLAPGSTSAIRQGDDWLARELPRILDSAAWSNNGAVFITFDENDYSTNYPIAMIVLSPLARGNGHASARYYDHNSTLRTMQEIFHVRPYLGAAAGAEPLNELFKDLSLAVAHSNGVVLARVENALPGSTNYIQASADLATWTTVQTNVATNVIQIAEPPGAASRRFFRVIGRP